MVNMEIPVHLEPYLEIESCKDFPVDRYYVSAQLGTIISEIIRMKKLKSRMNELRLPYLNATLMYGAPGTGKTTCGRYLAYYFDIPFVYVNFAKMFDGVFGKTSGIISDIFRLMTKQECIFMLDEIDCISQKRGTEGMVTGGEISRITVTLMQELDMLKKKDMKCILVGATNRRDIMDDALLGRFSLPIEIRPLNNAEKEEYIVKFLTDVGVLYDMGNIKEYCARNNTIRQRGIEADLVRGITRWLESGKRDLYIEHIRERD